MHARQATKNLCHADCQRDRAAGPSSELLAHLLREQVEIDDWHAQFRENSRSRVDGEIVAGIHRSGSD